MATPRFRPNGVHGARVFACLIIGALAGCTSDPDPSPSPAGPATSGGESSASGSRSDEREASESTPSVPDDVAARPLVELYDLGVQGALMEDWTVAATWFGYAHARSPHPTTLLALGASEARAGRVDEAVLAFERFVDAYPDHAHVGVARSALQRLRAGEPVGADFATISSNPYLE